MVYLLLNKKYAEVRQNVEKISKHKFTKGKIQADGKLGYDFRLLFLYDMENYLNEFKQVYGLLL